MIAKGDVDLENRARLMSHEIRSGFGSSDWIKANTKEVTDYISEHYDESGSNVYAERFRTLANDAMNSGGDEATSMALFNYARALQENASHISDAFESADRDKYGCFEPYSEPSDRLEELLMDEAGVPMKSLEERLEATR